MGGIFVGQHATNNGVFYAKRVPSLQSYPIYDHIEAATLSYPYDTMTTQGKNFDYKFNGVVIDVIMENVNDALAATKSMDYKADVTIDAQIIIQNQSPYEVKLNKIKNDGTEENSDFKAATNDTKKVDTKAGEYFVMYYNSTKIGIMKVDLTSDFLRKYRSMYGEKL